MIKFRSYFIISSLLLLVLIILAGFVLFIWGNKEDRIAAGVGLLISYINALIGFAILRWSYKKSMNEFMGSFYGGMIFRFLLIFAALFILIIGFDMPQISLIISLCMSYFTFLGLEVFIIHRYSELD